MHTWSDYRVFLTACRAGSLSKTAAELGVSLSTASRRLSTLEAALGEVLFARTPAGLVPTPAAHALRPHAEDVERAAQSGLDAVRALDPTPVGEVNIAVPADMLLLVVLPLLKEFLDTHPRLTLCFDSSPRVADLKRREADIAVRVRRPADNDELIATRLRSVTWAPFCRRALLDEMSNPADPAYHRWLGWTHSALAGPMLQQLSRGRVALQCSDAVSLRHAVQAGLGTGLLPRIFARAVPDLVEVHFPEGPALPTVQLQLITHRAVRHSPRVSAVWEVLLELLREDGDPDTPPERMQNALASCGIVASSTQA